jgi:hypothetical protein
MVSTNGTPSAASSLRIALRNICAFEGVGASDPTYRAQDERGFGPRRKMFLRAATSETLPRGNANAAQRFFHFGARFSTSARKPSCESSSSASSFRKTFIELRTPSRSGKPRLPMMAFFAMVSTGAD